MNELPPPSSIEEQEQDGASPLSARPRFEPGTPLSEIEAGSPNNFTVSVSATNTSETNETEHSVQSTNATSSPAPSPASRPVTPKLVTLPNLAEVGDLPAGGRPADADFGRSASMSASPYFPGKKLTSVRSPSRVRRVAPQTSTTAHAENTEQSARTPKKKNSRSESLLKSVSFDSLTEAEIQWREKRKTPQQKLESFRLRSSPLSVSSLVSSISFKEANRAERRNFASTTSSSADFFAVKKSGIWDEAVKEKRELPELGRAATSSPYGYRKRTAAEGSPSLLRGKAKGRVYVKTAGALKRRFRSIRLHCIQKIQECLPKSANSLSSTIETVQLPNAGYVRNALKPFLPSDSPVLSSDDRLEESLSKDDFFQVIEAASALMLFSGSLLPYVGRLVAELVRVSVSERFSCFPNSKRSVHSLLQSFLAEHCRGAAGDDDGYRINESSADLLIVDGISGETERTVETDGGWERSGEGATAQHLSEETAERLEGDWMEVVQRLKEHVPFFDLARELEVEREDWIAERSRMEDTFETKDKEIDQLKAECERLRCATIASEKAQREAESEVAKERSRAEHLSQENDSLAEDVERLDALVVELTSNGNLPTEQIEALQEKARREADTQNKLAETRRLLAQAMEELKACRAERDSRVLQDEYDSVVADLAYHRDEFDKMASMYRGLVMHTAKVEDERQRNQETELRELTKGMTPRVDWQELFSIVRACQERVMLRRHELEEEREVKEKEKRRDMFRRDRERKEREGATIEELREIEMEEEMKEKKIVEDARERREYELSEERQRVGGAKGPTVKNLTSQQLHELLLEDLKKIAGVVNLILEDVDLSQLKMDAAFEEPGDAIIADPPSSMLSMSDDGKYFIGLGVGPNVPPYLRLRGKVRYRAYTLRDIEQFLSDIWAAKADADAKKGKAEPLESFFYTWFKTKFGLQQMLAEASYNTIYALEQNAHFIDCNLFLKILKGVLSEDVHHDQVLVVSSFTRHCRKIDQQTEGRVTNTILKSDLKELLRNMFPHKKREAMDHLMTIAKDFVTEDDSVDYNELLGVGKGLFASPFVQAMKTQHLSEIEEYLFEIEDGLRKKGSFDSAQQVTIVTYKDVREAIIRHDPNKGEPEVLEYLSRVFDCSPTIVSKLPETIPITLDSCMKQLRRNCLVQKSKHAIPPQFVLDKKKLKSLAGTMLRMKSAKKLEREGSVRLERHASKKLLRTKSTQKVGMASLSETSSRPSSSSSPPRSPLPPPKATKKRTTKKASDHHNNSEAKGTAAAAGPLSAPLLRPLMVSND